VRLRHVAEADPEEGALDLALDLLEVQVQLVRAHAGQPDVEDEVRVGQGRELGDQGRLVGARGRVEVELLEPGLADGPGRGRDGPAVGRRLQLDEDDVARAVWLIATGSGAPVGIRGACRQTAAGTECQ
jgi:hypothetical protein